MTFNTLFQSFDHYFVYLTLVRMETAYIYVNNYDRIWYDSEKFEEFVKKYGDHEVTNWGYNAKKNALAVWVEGYPLLPTQDPIAPEESEKLTEN